MDVPITYTYKVICHYYMCIRYYIYACYMYVYMIGAACMDVDVTLYVYLTSEVGFFLWLCAPRLISEPAAILQPC